MPQKKTKKVVKKKVKALSPVEEKLRSMVENSTKGGIFQKKKQNSGRVHASMALTIILALVFISILFYSYNSSFQKNINALLKIESSEETEKTDLDVFNFPMTVVINENDPTQKPKIVDYILNVEENLQNTKINPIWLDKDSDKGKEIIALTSSKFIPIFVTDESITKHPKYQDFSGAIEQKNGLYTIRSEGVEYLVFPEIGDAQSMGANPDNSDLVIFEYASFSCNFCANMHPQLIDIISKYPNVTLVSKSLDRGGPDSLLAQAAECSAEQKLYGSFVSNLYKLQPQLYEAFNSENSDMSLIIPDFLQNVAKQSGANFQTLMSCVESDKYAQKVFEQTKEAQEFGVLGTPSLFIGSVFVPGYIPMEELEKIVIQELNK